jgi:antitoxin component YwqK of YwqJK toxin-antitoxin module
MNHQRDSACCLIAENLWITLFIVHESQKKMDATTKYITLLALLLQISGCGIQIEQVVHETYADGTPKIIHHYAEDGMDRSLKKKTFYYPDGRLRMEGEYQNGQKDGFWIAYYEDGSKWSEGFFKNGVSHGKTISYHENGKKYYEGEYREGIRIGKWLFYDETGKQDKVIDYDEGGKK